MNSEESKVSTEEQRRALDRMSAELLDKLSAMIAEQEARVQDFSLQQSSLSPLPQQQQSIPHVSSQPRTTYTPSQVPPSFPVHPAPAPAPSSVTPPPRPKQKQQPARQTPPPITIPAAPPKKKEDESSVGCGTLAVVIVVISVLMRACG